MKALKQTIKDKANQQKDYKNQRRTNSLVGERTMTTDIAAHRHWSNRADLRHLYAAYYFLRHNEHAPIGSKSPVNKIWVEELAKRYYEAPVEQSICKD